MSSTIPNNIDYESIGSDLLSDGSYFVGVNGDIILMYTLKWNKYYKGRYRVEIVKDLNLKLSSNPVYIILL